MEDLYSPPFTITNRVIHLISKISELLGKASYKNEQSQTPLLRRNRLRTIQASLAIENNTLSLEQVTSIINGKKVLGDPREILEVKNAFSAYELLEKLDPFSENDLLKAHSLLMQDLVEESGVYRSGNVGIVSNSEIVHVAPPAHRVKNLMADLLHWLRISDVHPLILSSVFHYEFEFIHPFADGNGRMGRYWQTLILSKWNSLLLYLPVETVIYNRQSEYYQVLQTADENADSTVFIEFMLDAILQALNETDQVSDQVSDQVIKLIFLFDKKPLSATEMMQRLNLVHKPTFRKNYIFPALENGFIEMTIPEKPNSKSQKYKLTEKGLDFKYNHEHHN